MNFLDTYEIAGTSPSSPAPTNQPEQSLNEEVSQVLGQLGRFWGGFRKQSQTALVAARKDLGDVVTQAQKELGKLSTTETPQSTSAAETSTDEKTVSQPGSQDEVEASPSSEADTTPPASTPQDRELPSSSSQSLFSRLQSSLPPNIVSTVQSHLPDTLKNASQNIDLAQLRTNLSTEFQRVQGVTRAQAEEYVHKSEGLLREAMREAGEVLRDAVKVIPPEEINGGSAPGVVWDGTDVWMLPSPSSDPTATDIKGKGRQVDSSSGRRSSESQRLVATRAESLLKQLKYDPAVVRADPEAEEGVKELYRTWVQEEVESQEGAFNSKFWTDKIASALNEHVDGQALQTTHDALVPSELTGEIFWKRYFFRVHQVEKEEERRKALLQGSAENEEDFSWEDDEEDVTAAAQSPKIAKGVKAMDDSTSSEGTLGLKPKPSLKPTKDSAPSSQAATSATTSPRLSSEDSFDLVSSGNVSNTGDTKAPTKKGDDDDADSDWE